MRIAFDVKGTLEGPKREMLVDFLSYLQSQNHRVYVWSNTFSYAYDCVVNLKLNDLVPMTKPFKSDVDEECWMDLAFDDDQWSTWLPTKRLIFVNELTPELMIKLKEEFREQKVDQTNSER